MDAATRELHKRRSGGSQIAKVCGFSKYGGIFDVVSEIMNQTEKEVTPAMERGTRLEPVVADMYFDRHREEGIRLRKPAKSVVSRKYPHAMASPDRIVMRSRKRLRGLEIKVPGWRQSHNWGDPASLEMPEEVICQNQWYMGHCHLGLWDTVAWVDAIDYREYRMEFDEKFFVWMAETNEEMWDKYIIPGILPDPLEAADPLDALKKVYPQARRPLLKADVAFEVLADSYRQVLAETAEHQTLADYYEAEIKTIIADAEGVEGEFGRFLWRNQTAKRTDWKEVAAKYRAILEVGEEQAVLDSIAAIEAAHTKEFTSRPFRKFFAKREDEPETKEDGDA